MLEMLFWMACGSIYGVAMLHAGKWAYRKTSTWYRDRPRQHHKRCLRNIERLEAELGLRPKPPERTGFGGVGVWQVRPKNFHQLVEVQRRYDELAAKHYGPQGGRTYKQAYLRAIERLEHGDHPRKRSNGL